MEEDLWNLYLSIGNISTWDYRGMCSENRSIGRATGQVVWLVQSLERNKFFDL